MLVGVTLVTNDTEGSQEKGEALEIAAKKAKVA